MYRTFATTLMVGVLAIGAAACGSDTDAAEPGDSTGGAAGGACLVGDADCYEDGTGNPAPSDPIGDEFPVDQTIQEAHGLLGMSESELSPDVRIARRGAEQMALTEDYRLGRMTVELDDTDSSGFRVVSVTVELPDGPQTFHLTPS